MFRRWAPFGWHYGFGFQVREARPAKQMFCRTPRSIRNTIISLLLISLLTWQIFASQYYWNKVGYAHHNNPSKPRVAIVTFITKQETYIHLGLKNKSRMRSHFSGFGLHIDISTKGWLNSLSADYASLQGYDLYIDYGSDSTRGTTWLKFDMIERVIQARQHDWIWYIDFDILITNKSLSLTNVIHENLAKTAMPDMIDFLVTDDWWVIQNTTVKKSAVLIIVQQRT